MRIELNYWEPVDWKRERSGNPVFRYVGVGLIVLLLALGWTSVKFTAVGALRVQHAELKEKVETLEKETAETSQKNTYVKMLKTRVFTEFDQLEKGRMLWCRNLEVFPNVVPKEMTLTNLIVRSASPKLSKTQLATLKKKKLAAPVLFTMAIAGIVEGDMALAEQTIETFSYDLASEKGFGTKLKSSELRTLGQLTKHQSDSGGVSFNINAVFNEVK